MGKQSRTLKFTVGTALAVAPMMACDKDGDEKHVNPGPVGVDEAPQDEKHVNEGPVEEPVETVNEGPVKEPTEDPVADTKGPEDPAPEPDGTVNVAPVKAPIRTNTARVRDPDPAPTADPKPQAK